MGDTIPVFQTVRHIDMRLRMEFPADLFKIPERCTIRLLKDTPSRIQK